MKSNLENPPRLSFTPIDTADFNVVAGGPGWVDTDVSATTGVLRNRVWAIAVRNADGTPVGARPHGATTEPLVNQNNTLTVFSKVDTSGHMDFYQNAATQATYSIFGYFEVL